MKYISVTPSVRTPYGVDFFDYAVDDGADVRPGDIITIPFRGKPLPALIRSVQPTSAFADKVVRIPSIQTILRLPPVIVSVLDLASAQSYSSGPTVLHAWLRTVPAKRAAPPTISVTARTDHGTGKDMSLFSATPFDAIRDADLNGRALILTPWQHRAAALGTVFGCRVLHAKIPYAEAWNAWTEWLGGRGNNLLVATRIGAWLSHAADTILIDEPENDDHKEDEQQPRLDARWIVASAKRLRPEIDVLRYGTTPSLDATTAAGSRLLPSDIPEINAEVMYDHWQRGGSADITRLSGYAIQRIDDALEKGTGIVVVDPFRDAEFQHAFHARYPAIPIFHLPDLHARGIPKNALVILTDIAGIGGAIPDIRKKERAVIAWRRLCSRVARSGSRLHVQGDEDYLEDAKTWLTPTGLHKTWAAETASRAAFKYPPTHRRIKVMVAGDNDMAGNMMDEIAKQLPDDWAAEGVHEAPPAPGRRPRWIIHLVPERPDQTHLEIDKILKKIAKHAMIDLDPIAFLR